MRAAREEASRRARLSDDQKLLEVKGMGPDSLALVKAAGYTTVDQLARENDLGRLVGTGLPARKAAHLVHYARVWTGEIPADAPPPEVDDGGEHAAP